jgi:hypothetical protein
MQLEAGNTPPPLSLIMAQPNRRPQPLMIMVCGSRSDTVITTSRSSRTGVDLTCQHTNRTVLVEGPEITVRPVGTRRVTGGPR